MQLHALELTASGPGPFAKDSHVVATLHQSGCQLFCKGFKSAVARWDTTRAQNRNFQSNSPRRSRSSVVHIQLLLLAQAFLLSPPRSPSAAAACFAACCALCRYSRKSNKVARRGCIASIASPWSTSAGDRQHSSVDKTFGGRRECEPSYQIPRQMHLRCCGS